MRCKVRVMRLLVLNNYIFASECEKCHEKATKDV